MSTLTCNACGWVHFAVSREYAEDEVWRFNQYFAGLDASARELWGNKPSTIDTYLRCFNCGGDYKNFRPSRPGDCPDGVTMQPILEDTDHDAD